MGVDTQGRVKTAAPIGSEPNGLLAGSARLDGTPITWPGSDQVKIDANGALTVSVWIKPEAVASGTVFKWGGVALELQGGKAQARVDKTVLGGGDLTATAWTQLALTVGGGNAVLYLNGSEVAHAAATLPALAGPIQVGPGSRDWRTNSSSPTPPAARPGCAWPPVPRARRASWSPR